MVPTIAHARRPLARALAWLVVGALITIATTVTAAILAPSLERELSRTSKISRPALPTATPEGVNCYWTSVVLRRSWGWTERSLLQEPEVSRSGFEFYVCAEFIEAGWPLRCATGERWTVETRAGGRAKWLTVQAIAFAPRWRTSAVVLPYGPMWPGLMVNAVLYGAAAWVAWRTPRAVRGLWRLQRRRCSPCGYPIGRSTVCTECGRTVPGRFVQERAS